MRSINMIIMRVGRRIAGWAARVSPPAGVLLAGWPEELARLACSMKRVSARTNEYLTAQ